jgi:hypothetical protein
MDSPTCGHAVNVGHDAHHLGRVPADSLNNDVTGRHVVRSLRTCHNKLSCRCPGLSTAPEHSHQEPTPATICTAVQYISNLAQVKTLLMY